MSETGWFADVADEEDTPNPRAPWQPVIQTAGCCFPLPVWFESREACEQFIRADILGRELLP